MPKYVKYMTKTCSIHYWINIIELLCLMEIYTLLSVYTTLHDKFHQN